MNDFYYIDWKLYNKPPFYQQWLCKEDTLKLATFGDKGLAEIDKHILSLKDQWDLNNITEHFLDRIGKLLSEPRNGNNDDYYRIILKLRRLLNTNDGSIPSIIKAIKFIYSSEVVHIVPNYPAGLIVEHDGEGTPGLNFNKLLTEIIPAGVSFNTKELFYFIETVVMDDALQITVNRKESERFGNPIKYDGTIKYDGHTINRRAAARGFYDGKFKYNGDLKFNGIGMAAPAYPPTPPFKYSSGIYDKFKSRLKTESPSGETSDTEVMSENVFIGIRKHHKFNGKYKYNGAIEYDGGALIPLE